MVACHTWQANPSAIPDNGLRRGSYVRVHSGTGAKLEFTVVNVTSDSLIGRSGKDRIVVALADIRRVDTARFSGDRTAAMVVASVLAIPAGFILLLLMSGESIGPTL
jgi:hypothetical protein